MNPGPEHPEHTETIGTRTDPHAQGRAARQQPLLLHSLRVFRELFELIYAHRDIQTVVEVGVESGQVSGTYAELGATLVYCVDPFPSDQQRAAVADNPALRLVERPSPEVLAELRPADLYVLDGDHNYTTVLAEVSWVLEHAPDAVVVLHDLMWPCSRRDLYYQPSALPARDRLPETEDGPTIWHDEMTPAGFVGAGAFTFSQRAGGEHNGVLTAVEDALASPAGLGWRLEIVPAVFGFGVLLRDTPETAALLDALRPYSRSHLLGALENNRIALYTRLLQLQYEADAHAAEADRLAETVAAQRTEIARLTRQLDDTRQAGRSRQAALQQQNADLRGQLAAKSAGTRVHAALTSAWRLIR